MKRGRQTITRLTEAAARLALLLIASSCWVVCATPTPTPTSRKPERAPAINEPSPVRGPACVSTGPHVDVTITSYIKGKPPHETFVTEVRVRNALAVPVWLLYDVGDSFPSIVTSVELSRTTSASAARVWSFSGDGGFETVRIPGDGQITLRHVELSCVTRDPPPAIVFASRITVAGQPAEEWFGRPGLLPTTGDFDLTSEQSPVTEHEWQTDDSLNAPAVHVDVLCVSRVNLSADVAPTP